MAADGLGRLEQTDDHFYALEARCHGRSGPRRTLANLGRARRDEAAAVGGGSKGARRPRRSSSACATICPGPACSGVAWTARRRSPPRRAGAPRENRPRIWVAAVAAADRACIAWPMAHARYRLAKSMIRDARPAADAEAALVEAHGARCAIRRGPAPGLDQGLARRARVRIPVPERAARVSADAEPVDAAVAGTMTADPPRAAAIDDLGLTRREGQGPLVAAGFHEQANRRDPVHPREHGRRPRLEHPRQARRRDPDGGRRGRRASLASIASRLEQGQVPDDRRSSRTTSHTDHSRSRPRARSTPTWRNPTPSCSRRLAEFSAMTPANSVQKPADSDAGMTGSRSARPTPRRCASAWPRTRFPRLRRCTPGALSTQSARPSPGPAPRPRPARSAGSPAGADDRSGPSRAPRARGSRRRSRCHRRVDLRTAGQSARVIGSTSIGR